MALPKLFQRIFWHNNTTPAIQEDNLNAMSKGLSDVDDRVIGLAGTIMEDVPQIQDDIEELEADMALIDTKIASATAEANRATTAANNAAASVISAGNKALVSEGWAKGTQNGTAVGSSSPYYHNNAEYFKNQARSFTPQGYQDLVDDVDSLKETLTNFEESITGEVVDSEPYVLRQGKGNLADMDLVGGSVAWNQLTDSANIGALNLFRATISRNGNSATVTENRTTSNNSFGCATALKKNIPSNHVVFISVNITNISITNLSMIRVALRKSGGNAAATEISKATTGIVNAIVKTTDEALDLAILGINTVSKIGTSDNFTVKDMMVSNLTTLFGSTIADYIYALEQATEGAGVAWFRKYFPNAYYGYQSGKIENVNVASRKVVGKNLVELFFQTKTINGITFVNNGDGTFTLNGTATATTNIRLDQKADGTVVNPKAYLAGTYTMSKNSTKFGLLIMQESTFIGVATLTTPDLTGIRTIPNYIDNCFVYISIYSGVSFNNETFKVQIERGNTVTAFEPYQSSTYAFDSSKQLRGVPKLVDNKLSYNGDIYKADGSITRKYGIVDLGSLTWTANTAGSYTRFGATGTNVKPTSSNSIVANIICSKYVTDNFDAAYTGTKDKIIAISNGGSINVVDSSYTDAATFKTAMSGVYLVYELATPTTESAAPFQNPQRAFIDGTEEFIDYGVQSATRDVSIPVGNNTTYQLNETLPPIEDYVDGALKFKAAISALGDDESGRTTASKAYTTGEFFYKDGKMYKVLASIAQGATFTINTNCQQTTLFAELKALAQ